MRHWFIKKDRDGEARLSRATYRLLEAYIDNEGWAIKALEDIERETNTRINIHEARI